jgi:hypothetical protein
LSLRCWPMEILPSLNVLASQRVTTDTSRS